MASSTDPSTPGWRRLEERVDAMIHRAIQSVLERLSNMAPWIIPSLTNCKNLEDSMDAAIHGAVQPIVERFGKILPSFPDWRRLENRTDAMIERGVQRGKWAILASWGMTSRRMRTTGAVVLFFILVIWLSFPSLPTVPVPRVSLEYAHSPFNHSKVALLIENRPNPLLAPLMLHFMAVVPPEWRFRFMGSAESIQQINQSVAIREHVTSGKLDLTYIPVDMSTNGQEMISRFLTSLWLYETVLQPAEWLLIFQTDSMLCANSRRNINDYLEYDWIGAPWNPFARWGGNGGLSLRRVSAMVEILREQVREDNSEPEDVWLAERLADRPGSKVANGTVSLTFSGEMNSGEITTVEQKELLSDYNATLDALSKGEYISEIDDWRNGFYEPMGYHTGASGSTLHPAIWGTPELRKHIWNYCPEIKMTLNMDAARYVPGDCNAAW